MVSMRRDNTNSHVEEWANLVGASVPESVAKRKPPKLWDADEESADTHNAG